MIRVRFGIKTGWPFPNKAIFVGRVRQSAFSTIETSVQQLRSVLRFADLDAWADALVWEKG